MFKLLRNMLSPPPPSKPPRPAPTRTDIFVMMQGLRFPHGHLALGSLLNLNTGERARIYEYAEWLSENKEATQHLMKDIASYTMAAKANAVHPTSILWTDEKK
jgi:hypothetical protein